MRYPPPDALRLFASGEARDAFSLNAVARQITASRAPHSARASQSSSFVALRPSQAGSAVDVATRAAPRSRRASPSPRTHSSRSRNRAEPVGEVILQTLARFAEQLAAQSAAQSAAQLTPLSAVMQRFETLHPATPSHSRRPARQPISASRSSSRRASPSPQRSSHRQSALDAGDHQGVSFRFPACPLALDPRATTHQLALSARIASPVPLGAAQQSHQLAPSPLAPYPFASPAPSALQAPSSNPAESPQSGHLLAPHALPSLSFASLPSHLQYVLQYSQSAPGVASTVVVPAALQPGTTSALYVPAPLQFEAVAVQPASQAGAPLSMGAHPSQAVAPLGIGAQPSQVGVQFASAHPSQAGAPLGMGDQPSQVGAPFAGAHPSQAGAPLGMGAQLPQAGAPLSMGAQPVQAGAQYVIGVQPVAQV